METKILKVGITGGIGSGKTLVSRIFSILGIPVYDADSRAKWISNFHPEVKKEIVQIFGEAAYLNDKFNSRYIISKIINDKTLTKKLNQIIHPRVGDDFKEWTTQYNASPYILKEAALMFESDSYKTLDKIIVVTAPLDLRIKRILLRDPQRTESEIKSIIDKQLPEEDKINRADFLIYNNDQQLVIPQVIALDKQFRALN